MVSKSCTVSFSQPGSARASNLMVFQYASALMNSGSVTLHPVKRILLIPKEKLVSNKNDGIDMKSLLSLFLIEVALYPFYDMCVQLL